MQKIVTFLTFNNQAEEAVNLYVSLFRNSKITSISYYEENMHMPKGTVLMVTFELEGQPFMALNAGPHFSFSQGISLYVNCESQEEVDRLWDKLIEGGKPDQCGWLRDKYGVSWQIIPTALIELIQDKNREKANKAMQAMMQMVKIDIQKIKDAYNS